jgi:acyl-coenzyme A synthetase/AMP-(fatty) acid ligase/acyl carrier protein
MLEHRGAINLFMAQQSYFTINAESRVLQYASINFDAATWEWIMALLAGASLYICEDEDRYDPEKLQNYLATNAITHATLPPAILQHLSIDKSYAFEVLIVAGEAFDEKLSQQWGQLYPFYNGYGPTETTVCATISSAIRDQKLNIGQAIANTQVYVLDRNRQLLPKGAIGELYVGGMGLARAYINQQKLTSACFIQHQFSDGKTQRLYKTGDLVHLLDDGSLVFDGRVDHQVKIRGNRIELGEIQHQLLNHNAIQSALVIVQKTAAGENSLVAYFTADSPSTDTELSQLLRQDLQQHLPSYMVPSIFMRLSQFPLTINGKIDHRALPEADVMVSDFLSPQGENEKLMASIWSELLKLPLEKISADANFFDLGGHSLLAVKLLTNIRHQFDINLKIQALFESKTLSILVAHLEMLTASNETDLENQQDDLEHFEI